MASPAPTTILSPPSSTTSSARPSLEVPSRTHTSSPASSLRAPKARTNRSALRQFYGLAGSSPQPPPPTAEIDRENLDAAAYVDKLCESSGMRELLRAENELVHDIRGFNGERKALVYDNYSKLITATDTIRRMRASMEPLTPTTSTLEPAIAHIAVVSEKLVGAVPAPAAAADGARRKRERDRETVRWALAAPDRIRRLVAQGRTQDAEALLARLVALCAMWEGVAGTEELRRRGEAALRGE